MRSPEEPGFFAQIHTNLIDPTVRELTKKMGGTSSAGRRKVPSGGHHPI